MKSRGCKLVVQTRIADILFSAALGTDSKSLTSSVVPMSFYCSEEEKKSMEAQSPSGWGALLSTYVPKYLQYCSWGGWVGWGKELSKSGEPQGQGTRVLMYCTVRYLLQAQAPRMLAPCRAQTLFSSAQLTTWTFPILANRPMPPSLSFATSLPATLPAFLP